MNGLYIGAVETEVMQVKETLKEFKDAYEGDLKRNEGKPYPELYNQLGTLKVNLEVLHTRIGKLLEIMK